MSARRRVAVVGLGTMGMGVAARLLERGHEVFVWNRTAQRTEALVERGARRVRTPAEAAAQAEAVIVFVADPQALEAVVEGEDGFADTDAEATIIVMATVGPQAVARLAARLPRRMVLIDAPVMGSVAEAESGTLTIFVGGDAAAVAEWASLLGDLGRPLHVGGVGSGSAAKLVANLALLNTVAAFGESLALANALGLAREVAFAVLESTPLAPQVARRRTALEAGAFPPRFRLALARKDADLIVEAAHAPGVELRLAQATRSWLVEADLAGRGDEDYAAILAHIRGGESSSEQRAETPWLAVDAYVEGLVVRQSESLGLALETAAAAGLPAHDLTPSQGKLLMLLARAIGAKTILELGTLAGYSAIWLAGALPEDGHLITLEANRDYAAVARRNIERAGLADCVEVRVGQAFESLAELVADGVEPFDLIFLDADKQNNARYLPWLLELSRPGTMIVADNVVREGRILDEEGDEAASGLRDFFSLVAREPRLSATVIQTVGSKGYDGFLLARVGEECHDENSGLAVGARREGARGD